MGKLNITKVTKQSEKKLIEKLYNISLMKNPEIKPYQNTLISLEKIAISSLSPTQRYIMKTELEKVKKLYQELKNHNTDLFNLNGYATIYLEEHPDFPIDVLPIIIEESIEKNGNIHLIVNDGMHRCYTALELNIIPQVIYVRGVDTDNYPYYAYPLKHGWKNKFDFLDIIPKNYTKKHYRREDYSYLYRNFNSQFNNTSGMRK